MKIIHVVSYVSPDGSYGGPTRVAQQQTRALARLGHDVLLLGGAPDSVVPWRSDAGVRTHLHRARQIVPALGFASLWSTGVQRDLRRHAGQFDVAHVHFARDLVSLRATRLLRGIGIPFVLQPHGMVDPSSRLLSKPVDVWETNRALRDAAQVLVLTDDELAAISTVEPTARATMVRNGIEISAVPPYADRDIDVLFLARLHARKRPLAFVEMVRSMVVTLPTLRAVIAGPDEGEARAVKRAIDDWGLSQNVSYIGAVAPSQTSALLARSRAYVLPSVGEIFPMSLIEAFAAGTPSVVTESLGIATECVQNGAAIVTDGTPQELSTAALRILEGDTQAENLRAAGAAYLRSQLDIDDVAQSLEATYRLAMRK